MALAFVSVNNAAGESAGNTTTAGTAAITPTMPASTVNGQTRVFVVQCHSGVAGTTPANWTALFKDVVVGSGAVSASAGQRYMSCYYRDKDASWSAMPSFPLTSSTQLSHWIGAVAVNKSTALTNTVFNTPTFTTPGSDFGTANTAHSDTTGSLTTHAGGFLIVGTVENDNVTMTTPGLTQTGATFASLTERCDGGTATGNDVAGKVHTASVTTGATAALTFTGTLSAASQGGSIVIEQTETLPKVSTLTEVFNSQDNSKWDYFGTFSVTGGRLQITPTTPGYSGLNTAGAGPRYDATGSSVSVRLVQRPNAGNGGVQFIYSVRAPDASNAVMFIVQGSNLTFRETVAGSNSDTSVTYDATDHQYLRLRESGGTVFWDTSPDGATWTNRRSKSTTLNMSSVVVIINSGYSGTEPSPGTTIIDNINSCPLIETLTDKFTTVDFDSIGPGAKTTTPNAGVSITHPSISKSDTGTLLIVGIVMARTTISSVGNFTVTCDGVAMTSKSTWTGNSGDYIRTFYTQNPGTGPHTIAVSADSTDWTHMIANTAVYQNVNFPLAGSVGSNTGSVNVSSNPGDRPFTIHVGLPQPTSASHTERFRDGSDSFNWMLWQDSNPANTSTYAMSIAGSTTRASSLVLDLAVADPPGNPGARWALTSNATFVNDQAVLAVGLGGGSESITSTGTYDLTGSSVSMQAIQYPLAGGFDNLRMRLQIDSTNYVSIEWYGPDQKLYFAQKVANVNSEIGVVLTDKWWRIRESGGTVYWDTSPDGLVWTNRRSLAAGIDLTNLAVSVQSTYWNAQASPGTAIIDNLNIRPPASSLTDEFTTLDSVKWPTTTGSPAVTAGKLVLPISPENNVSSSFNGFDLTSSSVTVELAGVPAVNPTTSGGTMAVLFIFSIADNTDLETIFFMGYNGSATMNFRETINNTNSDTSIAYDPVAHRFLRIRESGGTVFWDTSPDSITWTNRRSKTAGAIDLTNVWMRLAGSTFGTVSVGGTAIFDHFNLSVPPASSLTDDFSSDSAQWGPWGITTWSSGGRCVFPSGTTGGLDSIGTFDFTDSSVTISAPQVPNTAGVGVGIDHLLILQSTADTTDTEVVMWQSYNSAAPAIVFRESINSGTDQTSLTYDPVAHRYWRIRHSSSANLIYWDTSPDGATWTNQRSKTPGAIDLTSVRIKLQRNCWSGADPGGASAFDHFNLAVPLTASLTDDFTTNTGQWTLFGAGATISGGKLNITTTTAYDSARSVSKYDFTGSSVFAEITPAGTASIDETYLELRPTVSGTTSAANAIGVIINNGQLFLFRYIASVNTTSGVFVTYSATNHRWVRLRESAGTVYLDGSPDGVTWTQINTLSASTLDLTNMEVDLYAAKSSGSGTATFDNVNIPGVAAPATNQGAFFAMM